MASASELLNLAELDISNTGASSLAPLKELPLTILKASGNQISDVSPIAHIKFSELDLHNNNIVSVPGDFNGAVGFCGFNNFRGSALSLMGVEVLEGLCDKSGASVHWDGGSCSSCFTVP